MARDDSWLAEGNFVLDEKYLQLPLLSCTVSNIAFTLCSKIPPTLPNSVLTVGVQ